MSCVVAIGSEWIWGDKSIISFAFEIIPLEMFNEIIETAIMMFIRLFFAGLSEHITTINDVQN